MDQGNQGMADVVLVVVGEEGVVKTVLTVACEGVHEYTGSNLV